MSFMVRALVLGALVISATPSYAALVLDFSFDGGTTFSNQTTVLPGQTKELSLFLRETESTTILSTEGLSIFTIAFDYGTSEGAVTDVDVASPFSDSGSTASSGSGELSGFSFSPVVSETIALGTVQFTADNDANGDTMFVFKDFGPSDDVISGTGTVLDQMIFPGGATYTATITAVPEPASWVMLGICAGGLGWRRARQAKGLREKTKREGWCSVSKAQDYR